MSPEGVSPRSGPPPGGPSTITGVKYQMLWCLLRAVQMHVSTVTVDDTRGMTHAGLLLEPRNGGDVQEIGKATRRVVQLKTRSSGSSWSLREVVADVLPDLYRAVDLDKRDSSYDFITEGKMGQWQDVYTFFQSLCRPAPTHNLLDALDDEQPLRFTRQQTSRQSSHSKSLPLFQSAIAYTQRTMFAEIVRSLREVKAIRDGESEEQTQRKVWSLLGGFCFRGEHSLASAIPGGR